MLIFQSMSEKGQIYLHHRMPVSNYCSKAQVIFLEHLAHVKYCSKQFTCFN
jgi:hypothetical protein